MDGLIKYKITIKEEYEYRLIYSVSECCNSKWEFCEDSTNCGGLIRLIFFRTREACNNLYHNKVAIENALNNTTATEKSKSS